MTIDYAKRRTQLKSHRPRLRILITILIILIAIGIPTSFFVNKMLKHEHQNKLKNQTIATAAAPNSNASSNQFDFYTILPQAQQTQKTP